jgi:hypothetical protein
MSKTVCVGDLTGVDFIDINGVKYVRLDSVDALLPKPVTNHIIVIAQRGWIFIGHRDMSYENGIKLLDAKIVRKWTNGKGIGALRFQANKDDYTLDDAGTVTIPPMGDIAIIDVEW